MAAKKERYPYYEQRTSYIDGNAARNLGGLPERRVAEPSRIPEPSRTPQPRRAPREETRRRPKTTGMSVGSLLFLTIAAIATAYVCMDYLQTYTEVSNLEKNNVALERTLNNLSQKNDATYEQIDRFYDLGYVYQIAVEELGMVYPDKNLVITYESSDGSYLRQYRDIPD